MFLSFFLLWLNFYFTYKRGISFSSIFIFSLYAYFYPILFMDEVKFISDGIHTLPLAFGARISLWLGIIWMLCISWFLLPKNKFTNANLNSTPSLNVKYIGYICGLISFAAMIFIVSKHGVGLQGRSKADFMSGIGYDYKIFLISGLVLLIYTWLINAKYLRYLTWIVVIFDLSYGFRGMLASCIVMYLLLDKTKNRSQVIYRLGLGFILVVSLVIFKVSSYGMLGFGEIIVRLSAASVSDFLDLLVLANSESSTISAVFNEIIRQDYSVSFGYAVGAFFSPIPFAAAFGAPIVEFSEFYKTVVFGSEGSSFASGFLAVGYAMGGYLGIAAVFFFYSIVAVLFSKFAYSKNIVFRLMVFVLAVMSLITFPRSDFVYSFGAFRSYFIFILFLYISVVVFRMISKSYSSKGSF